MESMKAYFSTAFLLAAYQLGCGRDQLLPCVDQDEQPTFDCPVSCEIKASPSGSAPLGSSVSLLWRTTSAEEASALLSKNGGEPSTVSPNSGATVVLLEDTNFELDVEDPYGNAATCLTHVDAIPLTPTHYGLFGAEVGVMNKSGMLSGALALDGSAFTDFGVEAEVSDAMGESAWEWMSAASSPDGEQAVGIAVGEFARPFYLTAPTPSSPGSALPLEDSLITPNGKPGIFHDPDAAAFTSSGLLLLSTNQLADTSNGLPPYISAIRRSDGSVDAEYTIMRGRFFRGLGNQAVTIAGPNGTQVLYQKDPHALGVPWVLSSFNESDGTEGSFAWDTGLQTNCNVPALKAGLFSKNVSVSPSGNLLAVTGCTNPEDFKLHVIVRRLADDTVSSPVSLENYLTPRLDFVGISQEQKSSFFVNARIELLDDGNILFVSRLGDRFLAAKIPFQLNGTALELGDTIAVNSFTTPAPTHNPSPVSFTYGNAGLRSFLMPGGLTLYMCAEQIDGSGSFWRKLDVPSFATDESFPPEQPVTVAGLFRVQNK